MVWKALKIFCSRQLKILFCSSKKTWHAYNNQQSSPVTAQLKAITYVKLFLRGCVSNIQHPNVPPPLHDLHICKRSRYSYIIYKWHTVHISKAMSFTLSEYAWKTMVNDTMKLKQYNAPCLTLPMYVPCLNLR